MKGTSHSFSTAVEPSTTLATCCQSLPATQQSKTSSLTSTTMPTKKRRIRTHTTNYTKMRRATRQQDRFSTHSAASSGLQGWATSSTRPVGTTPKGMPVLGSSLRRFGRRNVSSLAFGGSTGHRYAIASHRNTLSGAMPCCHCACD